MAARHQSLTSGLGCRRGLTAPECRPSNGENRPYPRLVALLTDQAHSLMPSAFWLGGGSGAGKTTVARAVARRLDLRVYHVDARGYAHLRQMAHGDYPRTQSFNAMTYEERWLREPTVLAEEFRTLSRERMPLVIDDLMALGPGPTVLAEGPQLIPHLVVPLMKRPEAALWLLPTSEFGRRGVEARGEVVPSSKEADAVENRHQRDVLLIETLRQEASQQGLPVADVDGQRSLQQMVNWLARRLLEWPGGVQRAQDGEQRSQMRRQENAFLAYQLSAYWEDMSRAILPTAPVGPFSCECRTLGCGAEALLTVEEYVARNRESLICHDHP